VKVCYYLSNFVSSPNNYVLSVFFSCFKGSSVSMANFAQTILQTAINIKCAIMSQNDTTMLLPITWHSSTNLLCDHERSHYLICCYTTLWNIGTCVTDSGELPIYVPCCKLIHCCRDAGLYYSTKDVTLFNINFILLDYLPVLYS